jgi:hypothetical protein
MISWTFNVDWKPAFSSKKEYKLEYLQPNTVTKFVTGVSDLETKGVLLYERAHKHADSDADGQNEQAGDHVLGEGLVPNQCRPSKQ